MVRHDLVLTHNHSCWSVKTAGNDLFLSVLICLVCLRIGNKLENSDSLIGFSAFKNTLIDLTVERQANSALSLSSISWVDARFCFASMYIELTQMKK